VIGLPTVEPGRQAARLVRRSRRAVSRRVRRVVQSLPVDDRRALVLDALDRRLARLLKRVERVLAPPGAGAPPPPARATAAIEPVHEPLVLIGQVGRSGGTLLLRLFDGHPACRVVPHELGEMLPERPLRRDVERAARMLTPSSVYDWHELGMRVGKKRLTGPREHRHAFELHPDLLADLYAEVVRVSRPQGDRETLDAYFTAYFNAWRRDDGGTEAARPASWIVGFEPGAIASAGRMRRFDENYPDGRLISVLRDPWSWFASARRWSARFAHPGVALRRWCDSVEATLAYRAALPGRIHLIGFDELLLDTRGAMDGLAAFLEIEFDDALLTPSFKDLPVDDNSSFGRGGGGVSQDPATRRRDALSREEADLVESLAGPTWRRARAVLDAPAGAR
jgi:hypothetical protein